MVAFKNGQMPAHVLVQLDTGGGKHWSTAASAARWYALRAYVKATYGITLFITPGWNGYRPLVEQHAARDWACSRGNCLGAAYPGTSSHGGNWWKPGVGWVDAMAFDIGNWWLLSWDTWVKVCAKFGLLAGGIPLNVSGGVDERHHIIDLNPFGPVPAFSEVTAFVAPKPKTGDVPMFQLIALSDAKTIIVSGTQRFVHVKNTSDCRALLRARDALQATGEKIVEMYYGDWITVNGYLSAINTVDVDEAALAAAFPKAEFSVEDIAAIGAAAGEVVAGSVDDILAAIHTMPAEVVDELTERLTKPARDAG